MSSDEIELDPSAGPTSPAAAGTAALEGPTGARASTGADASAAVNANAELASALAAGQVDAAAARELLIEQVISEQLGALDPAQRARIEAELSTLLDADPTLDALLRP